MQRPSLQRRYSNLFMFFFKFSYRCFSSIGREGGMQILSLGQGCGYRGVIIHEIMHALGDQFSYLATTTVKVYRFSLRFYALLSYTY